MGFTLSLLFAAATQTYALPEGLLESLCYVETRHQITAIRQDDGGTPSLGVCQVKLSTARELGYKGSEIGLLDPSTNIHYAAKYLKKQIKRYGSVERGVVSYNRGNAKGITTSAYSRRVINLWEGRGYEF
jgi:soluble lytic murein transglycosylase-like protein